MLLDGQPGAKRDFSRESTILLNFWHVLMHVCGLRSHVGITCKNSCKIFENPLVHESRSMIAFTFRRLCCSKSANLNSAFATTERSWSRGCHGYFLEEYIRALYPYPLRMRAGDAYSRYIMTKEERIYLFCPTEIARSYRIRIPDM